MEFLEYLQTKKISAEAFQKSEKELYDSFENHFMQMHPNSFTAQKLFLINKLRLKYPIKADESLKSADVKPAVAKPKMKPKPRPKV